MFKRYQFVKAFTFIFVLLTTLYVCYRPLQIVVTPYNNPTSNISLLYSYGHLDRQLCKMPIDWTTKHLLDASTELKCPENEKFVSIAITGNLMWAYASVLAIAQQTGLKAYIPGCLKESLKDFFDNLTIPTFKETGIIHCPINQDTFAQSLDDWRTNPQQSIILPRYLIFPKEVMPWIPNIWREFAMKKDLRDSAQQTLKNLIINLPTKNYTFIGVHVRRTDYESFLRRNYGEDLARPQFFLRAMEYFKQKYTATLFIMVSDDPQWCIQEFSQLENVVVVTDNLQKENGPALDMAILVACNHTIYDYGTFGEWGAILAGGEAVCYDMIQNSKEGSMQYNESWHLMS